MTHHLAGIDISAEHFDVAHANGPDDSTCRQYQNKPRGHRALIAYLKRQGETSRVLLEATGPYFLDLALRLAKTPGIEVMVLNPRKLRHYRVAEGRRAKTDVQDAELALDYLRRMPFQVWSPPSEEALHLKQLSRLISHLTQQRARQKNRMEAYGKSEHTLPSVVEITQQLIATLNDHIEAAERQAQQIIRSAPALESPWRLMQTMPGIGAKTALVLLAELSSLPEGLSVRQWVALAGFDPTVDQSGKRLRGKKRISRRGKPTRVAQVAVMRKILHAVYGMLKTGTPFDGEKLFPKLKIA
jgi:transposase